MRNAPIFQPLMAQPLTVARQEGIALGEEKRAAVALMDVLDVRFQDRDVQILQNPDAGAP